MDHYDVFGPETVPIPAKVNRDAARYQDKVLDRLRGGISPTGNYNPNRYAIGYVCEWAFARFLFDVGIWYHHEVRYKADDGDFVLAYQGRDRRYDVKGSRAGCGPSVNAAQWPTIETDAFMFAEFHRANNSIGRVDLLGSLSYERFAATSIEGPGKYRPDTRWRTVGTDCLFTPLMFTMSNYFGKREPDKTEH